MRYFELKNTIYCGLSQFANGSKFCYHMREHSKSQQIPYQLRCTTLRRVTRAQRVVASVYLAK